MLTLPLLDRSTASDETVSPRQVLGAGRRTLARMVSRLPERTEAEVPPSRVSPPALVKLAGIADRVDRPDWALDLVQRAATAGSPPARMLHADLLLERARRGVTKVPYVGTQPGLVPARSAAIEHALVSGTIRSATQRARALATLGRTAEARAQALRIDDDRLNIDVLERVEKARGALTSDEHDELIMRLVGYATSHPGDQAHKARAIARLVAVGRFDEARRIAAGPCDPLHGRSAIRFAELTAEGRHSDARATKLALAKRIAETTPSWHDPVRRHAEWIRASSYVHGEEEALERLQQRWIVGASAYERLVRRKLRADLELSLGRPERHVSFRTCLESATPRPEHRFGELITGRNVLVVGPTETRRPTDEEYEQADVIVTTRRRETAGTATGTPIVFYVADSSARLDRTALDRSLTAHPDDMMVVRPSMLNGPTEWFMGHRQIRVMPTEDQNTFIGTRFAVQRILFDVLAYRPAAVTVTGIDFFVGADKYLPGYQSELSAIYEPNQLRPADVNASHDLAGDHAFTRSLRRSGLVDAPGAIGELLDLDTDSYLELLDRRRDDRSDGPSTLIA
ncbi:hypothetical protein YM304_30280 [Ilumatobacter coccineus YM16-304]|uniref:Uncharacterized protein n=2 Tax=Ilumatobacter coccineus TaxID=467094 RepID=A0A6C7EBG3_ILUCY|nr:hypothetical protein YM304_30280 [Ilumatobacter coccineus YM16-304]